MLPTIFNPTFVSLKARAKLDLDPSASVLLISPFNLANSPISPMRIIGSVCAVFFLLGAASSQAQSTGTDLNLRQFEQRLEKFRQREEAPNDQKEKNAALIDAFVDQYFNPRSEQTLRALQRAYRTGERKDSSCLTEILRLSNDLRLRNEFVRYAKFGSDEILSDKKLAIRAAVSLTDSRNYSTAAKYYGQWLRLTANEPETYLSVVVLIEKGRLNYLAREYESAESAFRRITAILASNILDANQKSQLLRNSETTYRLMANTFLKTGDFEEAKKFFDLAGVDSTSPIRFLHKAQNAFAKGNLDESDALVHQFIAKQPNNSDAFRLLYDLYARKNPSNEKTADQQFVADLENLRQKFSTGKVLDDFLIRYYMKLGRTSAAKEILLPQRSKTLSRDIANRQLVEIAFREKQLDDLVLAVAIEADEHDSLVAIRTKLKENAELISGWSDQLLERMKNAEPVAKQLAAACLLLNQNQATELKAPTQDLISVISKDTGSSRLRRIKYLTLLGRESVTRKQYQIALNCFQKCLELNRTDKNKWMDQRTAFDSLLSSVFVRCRLNQEKEAFSQLRKAEAVLRYSPSLMHLKGSTSLQFGDSAGAIVSYQAFLDRFDKSGASLSLSSLIERVRLEMAFAFFLMDRKDLARETINQTLDRNPFGPDLDAFQRNNQKYIEKKKLFLEFANGVKNGGPFPLGRN